MSDRGEIRRARTDEAETLSVLATDSKAYWGYDDAFMESCRAELAVSPEQLADRPAWVFCESDAVLGFYTLQRLSGHEAELTHLFVAPDAIGRGIGGRLLRHAREQAGALGCRSLRIESDPHAEPFYRAQGGEPIGRVASASIPGRELPVLRIDLSG